MKKETIEKVIRFRDERNWKQFHNPKDLAISLMRLLVFVVIYIVASFRGGNFFICSSGNF